MLQGKEKEKEKSFSDAVENSVASEAHAGFVGNYGL